MTDRYAVFGNPLSHSKSPFIHKSFAEATGQDMDYGLVEAPLDGFKKSLFAFRDGGGKGGNVTAPFKIGAFEVATRCMPRAEFAGAVNCLKFEGNEIIAENYDGVGLRNDIHRNLKMSVAGKRVLMLGAGGAARGALAPLLEAKPVLLTLINRTVEKAKLLNQRFGSLGPLVSGGYADIGPAKFDVVINATSASLRGESLPLPDSVFGEAELAYELCYGKGLTPFLTHAKKNKVRISDGVGMLVEQAAEAFEWWRDVRPRTDDVIKQLTVPLT
jgi:shikimate dehydrogenase